MPFTHLLDPFKKAYSTGLTNEDYAALIGVIDRGERRGRFKRVSVKGSIYSARFNIKGRIVFAEHTDNNLVLLAVFHEGQHDQYENFLTTANTDYKKWIASGAYCLSENIIKLSDVAKSSAIAAASRVASDSTTSEFIQIKELVSYGAQFLCLSDEQDQAIHVVLPALIQGPAGAGKTVVAFQMLQQLATAHDETQAPILYLGPAQLVRQLIQLWKELKLPDEKETVVQFKTVTSLAHDFLLSGKSASPEVFEAWYKENFRDIMSHKLIWPALMGKSNCKKNVEQEKPAKLMYCEFKLIAQFVASDPATWEMQYRASPMSHFLDPDILKEHFIDFFKRYNAYLQKHAQFDSNICCRQLMRLSREDYSTLIIDEAQLLPIAMTKWLVDSRIPIAFLCDPHQATSDATLGFLRLSHQLFQHLPTINLTGSYRVPVHIAACADRILQKKMQLVRGQSMSGAAAEFFSHHQGEVGELQWRENDKSLEMELKRAAEGIETAFIVFTPEDRDYVTATYGAVLVFNPEEIQGLEYPVIVIVNPEACLASVFKLERELSDTRKDKHIVFQRADEVIRLNQMFVAMTRAKAKLVIANLSSKRYTDDIKRLLGLGAGVVGSALPHAAVVQVTDWKAELEKQILQQNCRVAHDIWVKHLQRDPEKFDAYYHSMLIPFENVAPPVVAAAASSRKATVPAVQSPRVVAAATHLSQQIKPVREFTKKQQVGKQIPQKDNVEELLILGNAHEYGFGVPQDYVQAHRCYEQAAKKGHATALFNLGTFYHEGKGVTQDYAKTRQYWEQAAEKGQASALHNLGLLYKHGHGIPLDDVRARHYWEQAVEQGHVGALYNLGSLYKNGQGVPQDYIRARQYYEQSAEKGDVGALRNLGFFYSSGQGVSQDYVRARWYWEQAAKKGDMEALFHLGMLYQNGEGGLPQDKARARKYWEQAAEKGHVGAFTCLGKFYEDGEGIPQNYGRARRYYEQAAKKGEEVALERLGTFYYSGLGVPQDYVRARQYYEKAAEKGNEVALFNLGVLYQNGQGVLRNDAQARRYYEQAAEKGDTNALINLGVLYQNGEGGIPQDKARARKYWEQAAEQGHAGAIYNLKLL